jgi:hypothetical protein
MHAAGDHNNVFLSIDLVNCFNTMDRDMLIAECMLHNELVPLAAYVKNIYPPGMMCWVEVEDAWKGIAFENGTAQGRPLSLALRGILLRPALQAAKRAMDAAAGLTTGTPETTRASAAGGYLDDAGLVGRMPIVAAGFAAFVVEVNKRGWDVNFGKTVLGLNFYASRTEAETEAMRAEAADLFGSYQNDAGQGIAVEEEGMIFLGTPIGGEERPDVTGPDARGAGGFQATVPLGNLAYRERTVQGFIDDHDARLRQVVALGLRDGRSHTGLTHLSKQLAHHLLRHCCNSRDVHLLRGLPRRIVREAALRHDRAVKAALAAIGGYIDPPPADEVREDGTVVKHYLHEMELPFGQPLALDKCCGGFNML